MTRHARLSLALLAALAMGLFWCVLNARADPVVRRATIAMPDWPARAKPVTAALISDIHVGSVAMPVARLRRIVAQINALKPDIVLVAGDMTDGHDAGRSRRLARLLIAPLRGLRAPLGVLAVPGNHDHGPAFAQVRAALTQAGVTVLANDAVQRGPLTIIGIDDAVTGHDDIARSMAAAARLRGARVAINHDPRVTRRLPPAVTLMVAGHTHCGQILLPLIGPVDAFQLFDPRYRCGMVRDGARATVITAGLGTSVVPMRYGAPPDLWLLTLGPGD